MNVDMHPKMKIAMLTSRNVNLMRDEVIWVLDHRLVTEEYKQLYRLKLSVLNAELARRITDGSQA